LHEALSLISSTENKKGGGQGREMTQALYAHMNNKTIKKRWGGRDAGGSHL
jgi:hypothetical protein